MLLWHPLTARTLGPLVHHIFVPFKMYLSPFFSARVRMLTASDPAPGSLMDKAPICSPAQPGTVEAERWQDGPGC